MESTGVEKVNRSVLDKLVQDSILLSDIIIPILAFL